MILIDSLGHMISTDSAEELHQFAKKLGLKREWYQTPGHGENHSHYDLTTNRMKDKAKRMGVKKVHPFDIIKRAWWAKWTAEQWKNERRK